MELFRLFGSVFIKDEEANKGLDQIDKKAETTGGKLGKLAGKAGKASLLIGTGMVTAGVAVLGFAKKTATAMDRVDKSSQKMGLSAKAFQEWDYILSQSGASIDSMGVGIKSMTLLMDDANSGGAKGTEMFDRLGLSIEDLNEMSREEAFETMIGALQGIESETERATLAAEVFGKAGMELMPLLNSDAEAIDNMKQQANELGLVMGDEAVKGGAGFTDAMDQLQRSVQGALFSALAPLLPVITGLIQEFVKIVPPLMEFIAPLAEKLIPVISTLAEALIPALMKVFEALLPIIDPLLAVFLMLVDTVLIPFVDLLVPIIDTLMPIFIDLFNKLLPVIQPILEVLMELVKGVLPFFVEYWAMLAPIMMPLIDIFLKLAKDLLPPIMGIIQILTRTVLPVFLTILEKVFKIIGPLIEGIASVVGGITKIASGAVSKVVSFIGGIFGGKKKAKGAAEGGRVTTSGDVWVGEEGLPELVSMNQGATITPLDKMGGGTNMVLERGALEGLILMDDYGVDRMFDRMRQNLVFKDAKI